MALGVPRQVAPDAAALGGVLCELAAHVHSAHAELALRAAAFDAAGGWCDTGIRSCAHWLAIQAGLDLPTSRDLLRVGHALAGLPLIRAAFAGGQLSLDKVRAVLQVACPDDESLWLELALGADAAQLVRICREVRRSMDADAAGQADRLLARRGLWSRVREDGMLRIVALLPPEDGAVVQAALEAVVGSGALPEREGDPADEPWAARRGDALVAICEHAQAAAPDGLVAAPDAVQLVVHVDVGVLTGERPDGRCHLEDGSPLSAAVARRLGCDCEVVAITERDGLPIDVGRRRRLFTGKQRRALQARDRTCRYPGCQVPARRTRAHHIRPWWMGGQTNLANGLSLCGWHHARLHDGEYRVRWEDGEVRFERPDGTEIAPPRRPPLRPGGGAHLRRRHRDRGSAIDAGTPVAGWRGERGDRQYIADVYAEASASLRARAGPGSGSP